MPKPKGRESPDFPSLAEMINNSHLYESEESPPSIELNAATDSSVQYTSEAKEPALSTHDGRIVSVAPAGCVASAVDMQKPVSRRLVFDDVHELEPLRGCPAMKPVSVCPGNGVELSERAMRTSSQGELKQRVLQELMQRFNRTQIPPDNTHSASSALNGGSADDANELQAAESSDAIVNTATATLAPQMFHEEQKKLEEQCSKHPMDTLEVPHPYSSSYEVSHARSSSDVTKPNIFIEADGLPNVDAFFDSDLESQSDTDERPQKKRSSRVTQSARGLGALAEEQSHERQQRPEDSSGAAYGEPMDHDGHPERQEVDGRASQLPPEVRAAFPDAGSLPPKEMSAQLVPKGAGPLPRRIKDGDGNFVEPPVVNDARWPPHPLSCETACLPPAPQMDPWESSVEPQAQMEPQAPFVPPPVQRRCSLQGPMLPPQLNQLPPILPLDHKLPPDSIAYRPVVAHSVEAHSVEAQHGNPAEELVASVNFQPQENDHLPDQPTNQSGTVNLSTTQSHVPDAEQVELTAPRAPEHVELPCVPDQAEAEADGHGSVAIASPGLSEERSVDVSQEALLPEATQDTGSTTPAIPSCMDRPQSVAGMKTTSSQTHRRSQEKPASCKNTRKKQQASEAKKSEAKKRASTVQATPTPASSGRANSKKAHVRSSPRIMKSTPKSAASPGLVRLWKAHLRGEDTPAEQQEPFQSPPPGSTTVQPKGSGKRMSTGSVVQTPAHNAPPRLSLSAQKRRKLSMVSVPVESAAPMLTPASTEARAKPRAGAKPRAAHTAVVDITPAAATEDRPKRNRMRPLAHWMNERTTFERTPGSSVPSVAAVIMAFQEEPPRTPLGAAAEHVLKAASVDASLKQPGVAPKDVLASATRPKRRRTSTSVG